MNWSAIVLGIVGSLHCAGMCGPLALALPRTGRGPGGYLAGRLAYHLGRLIAYAVLGLVCGTVGKSLLLAGAQRWLSISLGIALFAGWFASRKFAWDLPLSGLIARLKFHMAGLLQRRSIFSLLTLGTLNGLLPCGLVYAAGTAAAVTGSIVRGAVYMALFGAGTIPLMLAISLSGKLVPANFRTALGRAIPASVILLSALLILRGLSLGIPFISPKLSAGLNSCCPH